MSLATIIKKIEEEAAAQGQEIIDQATTEDEQIITHERVKAEEEATQIVRHAEEEVQTLRSKRIATTLLQLRKEKLDNRQRILGDVFSEALQRVREYDEEQRRGIIKSILLSVFEERQGSLLFSEADKPLIDQKFIDEIHKELKGQGRKKLQFTLSKQAADIERGVIIDFKDFEVNCSFQKVLEELWTEIEVGVSKQLFEGDKPKEA